MLEKWRNVKGFAGCYSVSNKGRVRSNTRIRKTRGNGTATVCGRILKPILQPSGHLHVGLSKAGRRINLRIHRLVLEAFVGPCPEGMECRHFPDRDPANNNLENLSWGTHQENRDDMVYHGTSTAGEKSHTAKLTWKKVRLIRSLRTTKNYSYSKLGKMFGVHHNTIIRIISRQIWKE